ncbi:hypothetical protein J3A83DRAFT_4190202 [Scleroderma citrinum]
MNALGHFCALLVLTGPISRSEQSLLMRIHGTAFCEVASLSHLVDQEPKVTCSGNAQIHGMHSVTKASIVYVVTQTHFALTSAQIFSQTDLVTDSEHFYSSIVELLDDPDEKEEVHKLMTW